MIKEDVRMKKWVPKVLLAAALAGLSAFLLKGDVWTFWTWWLLLEDYLLGVFGIHDDLFAVGRLSCLRGSERIGRAHV